MADDQQSIAEALEWQQVEIAGQIHDDLLPYLFAASASLHAAQRQLSAAASGEASGAASGEKSGAAESLLSAKQCVDTAQLIARRMLSGLVLPSEATENPLATARDALEQLLSVTSESAPEIVWTGCETAEQSVSGLDPSVAAGLYRLVWEAVRNAVRHARASRIDVRAVRQGETLQVHVVDDGIGIDSQAARQSGGLGRKLMQRRAEAAGIDLSVHRRPGGGTQITLRVPLAAN